MKKRLLRKLFDWKVFLLLLLLIAAIILGALIDRNGFFVNISAGIFDIFLGFFIAIYVLDKYQEAAKEEQWKKVRDITYTLITTHLANIIEELIIYFAEPLPELFSFQAAISGGRYTPTNAALNAMEQIADKLFAVPVEKQRNNSKANVRFFSAVKWDLSRIGDNLTPRVLQFSTDDEIIDALIKFDKARDEFQNAILVEETISIGILFTNTELLVRNIQSLYRTLIAYWERENN